MLAGLGRQSRTRLAELLRKTKGTISVEEASVILGLGKRGTAKLLARWSEQGWLYRVRRGLYVPVPLESVAKDVAIEDPWLIAQRLFSPCYIGGWSAAEYWGLTEQIFRSLLVITPQGPRNRSPVLAGITMSVHSISGTALFGLKPVWRGEVKVQVSDPTRTVLDMLDRPSLGGGLRPTVDVIRSYMKSEFKNTKQLVEYADRLGNKAVFKRLGFLAERFFPNEKELVDSSRVRISKGNARLDPGLKSTKLVTKWRLWIPSEWDREGKGD
ncbi:type IV toxin-antitoxin system AbiEi family antitoxin domain-containing protein [bacterium]|nr:type IV toxin-antitoxin system AbiEi family antitoxin domain-containing protein [bacterium]